MPHEMMDILMKEVSVQPCNDDSKSLSRLLPRLKKLHAMCKEHGFDTEANMILKARSLITTKSHNKNDMDETNKQLAELFSDLSTSLYSLSTSAQTKIIPELDQQTVSVNEVTPWIELEQHLQSLTLLTGGLCDDDELSNLKEIIAGLKTFSQHPQALKVPLLNQIADAGHEYLTTMVKTHICDTKPIEEALTLARSVIQHCKHGKAFSFDCTDVFTALHGVHLSDEVDEAQYQDASAGETVVIAASSQTEAISDDDLNILMDFVTEAEDNLDTIEINLIDLEQDPVNKDIINDIFRPFHTIKGVSGFLSLAKINQLAHATENLLDSARSGEFLINDTATDAILESVDTLKRLLDRVRQGISAGFTQPDDDIDIDTLRDKLQRLQVALTKGDKEPLGSILVKKNKLDQASLDQALETQKRHPDKKIGELLVEARKVQPSQIASALMDQNLSKRKPDTQVKVSTQKLDDLVDYAGEMVIAQSMLRQKTLNNPLLSQNVSQLGQIVANMQNIAMSMRMIPIKSTFTKMIRLVRDLARKSGKDVNLSMAGEDTEIDRNVVDALYEPMVHMIRNSVDHGIEEPAVRLDHGKPSQGEIKLRAYHKGGYIIIEIEDDGKGLDKVMILAKAKSTGLLSGKEELTDAQVYDLILQPGFSTARRVTDVSGRGVGMDVVKGGIEKFRGHLNIASEHGKGTKFTISLPLTLAIIDGMLVRVDDQKYVIPTTVVQKAFKPGIEDCFTVEGKAEMIRDRGSLIPVIRLNQIYNRGDRKKPVHDYLVVVVESKDEKRALLIDELLGKDEYVIKSLGTALGDVEGISGGAILSDGRVGLILDIHGIFSSVSTS